MRMLTELSFDGFMHELAPHLGRSVSVIDGGALLVDDLGLDSLEILILVLGIEEFAEVDPTDEMPLLFTTQDAYDYYIRLVRGKAEPREATARPDVRSD